MSEPVIRIAKIELNNFKCVGHGEIELNSGVLFDKKNKSSQEETLAGPEIELNSGVPFDKKDRSSREEALTEPDLLGIFGQNGSGKSSVIEALEILKLLMKGESIKCKRNYADCIAKGENSSELTFTFVLGYPQAAGNGKVEYSFRKAKYSFCIGNSDTMIFNEKFSLSWETLGDDGEKKRLKNWPPIIDTSEEAKNKAEIEAKRKGKVENVYPFDTETKRKKLIGEDPEKLKKLRDFLNTAREESRSFIFSSEILDLLETSVDVPSNIEWDKILSVLNKEDEKVKKALKTELVKLFNERSVTKKDTEIPLWEVLRELRDYASNRLYVLLDANLLGTQYEDKIRSELWKINSVLSCFVPGLEIDEIDSELKVRRDNGCLLPLQRESDGIKKLISVLSLFVLAFEQHNVTVAIDNFDDGIFEYSVGEIANLFVLTDAEIERRLNEKKYKEKYKDELFIAREILGVLNKERKYGDKRGQFIFTTHNFSPLEVIDKKFVYFTTGNKNKSYQDYGYLGEKKNIVESNNLRDKYRIQIIQIQKGIADALKEKLKIADSIG